MTGKTNTKKTFAHDLVCLDTQSRRDIAPRGYGWRRSRGVVDGESPLGSPKRVERRSRSKSPSRRSSSRSRSRSIDDADLTDDDWCRAAESHFRMDYFCSKIPKGKIASTKHDRSVTVTFTTLGNKVIRHTYDLEDLS